MKHSKSCGYTLPHSCIRVLVKERGNRLPATSFCQGHSGNVQQILHIVHKQMLHLKMGVDQCEG